jgi:hypothetical protein
MLAFVPHVHALLVHTAAGRPHTDSVHNTTASYAPVFAGDLLPRPPPLQEQQQGQDLSSCPSQAPPRQRQYNSGAVPLPAACSMLAHSHHRQLCDGLCA